MVTVAVTTPWLFACAEPMTVGVDCTTIATNSKGAKPPSVIVTGDPALTFEVFSGRVAGSDASTEGSGVATGVADAGALAAPAPTALLAVTVNV